MIEVGASIIFYPRIGTREVEASGTVRDTNDYGAFISYCWQGKEEVKRTKEFFGWDELKRVHVLSMGLCEWPMTNKGGNK